MAKVTYRIKTKSNPASIYVRLRDGRNIDLTAKTGKTIYPKFWKDNKIKRAAAFDDKLNLENALNDLTALILRKRNDSITDGIVLSNGWLQEVLGEWQGLTKQDKSTYFDDVMQLSIDKMPFRQRQGKVGLSPGSIKNYKTSLNRFKKFQVHKASRILLSDINLEFYNDFLTFLRDTLGLAANSIGKVVKNIKTICREAQEQGLKVNQQVFGKSFIPPSEETMFTTLNPEELELIATYEGKQYLENARDWLIISCWTGCRVGDLMKLDTNNIKKINQDINLIEYTQNKTGKTIKAPMRKEVELIIERLGSFPRPTSPEKYNDYIKQVCQQVGINEIIKGTRQNPVTHKKEVGMFEKWKLIRSHIGRRSFATNHYNEFPNKVIMAVTGHSTEKQFLKYIGEVESDHLQIFIDQWSRKGDT